MKPGSADRLLVLSLATAITGVAFAACSTKAKTTNGTHHVAVQKVARSNIEAELKEFGQGLRKDHPDDVPIEILFETDDPTFTKKPLEAQDDACGELRGGTRPYISISSGLREKLRACIFLGPPPSGDLIFQPKGYPPISVPPPR